MRAMIALPFERRQEMSYKARMLAVNKFDETIVLRFYLGEIAGSKMPPSAP